MFQCYHTETVYSLPHGKLHVQSKFKRRHQVSYSYVNA